MAGTATVRGICPVRILLDQFSDRWAIQAIFALSTGPVRSNALRRELHSVSQKVLGQTLQRLKQNGLVRRNVIASKPIAVEYELTALGLSLLPVVEEMKRWATRNEACLLSARESHKADHEQSVVTLAGSDALKDRSEGWSRGIVPSSRTIKTSVRLHSR